jgi:hypothetical protein
MAELEADTDYVGQRDQQDRELRRKESEWRRAEAPLTEELAHDPKLTIEARRLLRRAR